jgi:prepilin-type N-terminal cleavage/methylation domain-containing protein
MRRSRAGFTVIELLVVVVLAAMLTQLAVKTFGLTSSHIAAREARNVFNGLVARARAQAIESGIPTMLVADADGDSVMVFANGNVAEKVRFGEELGVDIQTEQRITRICMNTRGYADTDCNSFSSVTKMAFSQGTKSTTIEIFPLGQIRW